MMVILWKFHLIEELLTVLNIAEYGQPTLEKWFKNVHFNGLYAAPGRHLIFCVRRKLSDED